MATRFGTNGDDILTGGRENDLLYGQDGEDNLDGGTGKDSLKGGAGEDNLNGGTDEDTLTGDTGADNLDGGAGNDNLDGGADEDNLSGGAGDDLLKSGAGNDTLEGGAGKDTLTGDAGADKFVFSFSSEGIDSISNFSDNDKIVIRQESFDATSTDQFIYKDDTGALLFDASTTDDIAAVQFASLPRNLGSTFNSEQDITLSARNSENEVTIIGDDTSVIIDGTVIDS